MRVEEGTATAPTKSLALVKDPPRASAQDSHRTGFPGASSHAPTTVPKESTGAGLDANGDLRDHARRADAISGVGEQPVLKMLARGRAVRLL